MSGKRYTEEFKVEAVKQVTERGHPVAEVASRALPVRVRVEGLVMPHLTGSSQSRSAASQAQPERPLAALSQA